MQICFVHDHCFTLFNGSMYSPGQFTSHTWRRFDDVFDKVVVVARFKHVASIRGLESSSCDRVVFDCLEQKFGGSLGMSFSRHTRQHLRAVLSHADLLVARLPSFLGSAAISIVKKLGKPYVVEVVGDPKESLRATGRFGWLFSAWMSRSMANQVRDASGALYVTSSLLQSRYPCLGVIGIASNVDIKVPEKNVYRDLESHNRLRIGVIGSYTQRYKGIGVAIAAINKLSSNLNISLTFECVGGPPSDDLREVGFSARDEVQLKSKGILSKVDLINWLDSLDIYLQPSFTEGLPRGLIEAMSRGIPSVATSVGGIPELLPIEWRFAPGNVEQLSLLLKKLADSQTRMNLSAICFDKARLYDRELLELSRKRFYTEVKRSVAR